MCNCWVAKEQEPSLTECVTKNYKNFPRFYEGPDVVKAQRWDAFCVNFSAASVSCFGIAKAM